MNKKFITIIAIISLMFTANFAFADNYDHMGNNANAGATAGATAQSAVGSIEASPTQSLTINNPATDLSKGRGFAIPGEIVFPGTPGYFGEATPGHQFIPLVKLIMYKNVWTRADADTMLDGYTGRKNVAVRPIVKLAALPADAQITASGKAPEAGKKITPIAFGTVSALNGKAISADVFAMVVRAAADAGANYIQFTAEGTNREVGAQGVGIGFHTTQANLYSGDNSKSNVSTGGLGWSKGWAGYSDLPWLQFTLLTVE